MSAVTPRGSVGPRTERPTESAYAGRIVGLDIARCLALLGMMATHILNPVNGTGDQITLTQQVAGGRSSALFAVLAGVSMALMSGRTEPVRGRDRLRVTTGLAVRALLIAGIGLLLGDVQSGIAVILTYYGLLFLLGLPFLGLRARPLLVLAGIWLLVVPVISHLVRPLLPPRTFDNPTLDRLGDPGPLLSELALTGFYPALPWLAYLFAGLALGRMDLTRWRTAGWLGGAGAVLAAVSAGAAAWLLSRPGAEAALADDFTGPGALGSLELTLDRGLYGATPTGTWWWLAVDAPHSTTPFDLAATIGSAFVVVALALVVGRLLPRLGAVVFGAGAMTLTLYSLHVLSRAPGWWDGDTAGTYLGQVVAVLAIGAAYRLAQRRGPLESMVTRVSARAGRAVAGRAVASG